MNLVEGIQEEMNRNREVLKQYEEIGPSGMFGATMIKQDIVNAENAIAGGDVITMLRSFEALKENKG